LMALPWLVAIAVEFAVFRWFSAAVILAAVALWVSLHAIGV
jgi:hypothetical protein